MNKITGFSVLTTGEGERVTLSYSVLDADGQEYCWICRVKTASENRRS